MSVSVLSIIIRSQGVQQLQATGVSLFSHTRNLRANSDGDGGGGTVSSSSDLAGLHRRWCIGVSVMVA
jgi:hypothetical protein